MAQLTPASPLDQRTGQGGPWTPHQTWSQYAAIAWLRWRMVVNLARRSNTPGEIAGKVVLYILLGSSAIFLTAAAGGIAWFLASQGQIGRLWMVFWGIFVLCQLLNINLGQPGTTFDPTDLIRFPLRVRTYIAIRLFFNLLSPANVMAMLMSLAVAVGIPVVMPGMWAYALLACAIFAATNVLFSRMIFAWIDRWLSTRRAREVFTAAIFIVSLGIQYANFAFNPAYGRSHHQVNPMTRQRLDAAGNTYLRVKPLLRYLPPHLTSSSLEAASHQQTADFLAGTAGCAAYGALFLLVFALRMRTEFRGEALSDAASSSSLPAAVARTSLRAPASTTLAPTMPEAGFLSGSLLALLSKEWTYIRRNTGLLYGLVTPLFLIILFALRMGRNFTSPWVVPIAIAYSLVGIAPMSYNSFGLDGTGAQLYFMTPVPFSRIFLAKNLLHFALALLEVVVVIAVMGYVTRLPSAVTLAGILLWAVGSLLLNTTLGNRRSITAPKKIDLSRMARKQASQTSALMSLGVLAACVGYGAGVLALAAYFGIPWLALPCFAALAAAGFLVYRASLTTLQSFTLAHRDMLFEELGKS